MNLCWLAVVLVFCPVLVIGQSTQPTRAEVHSKQVHVGFPGQIPDALAHSPGDVHLSTGRIVDRIMPPDAAGAIGILTCDSRSDVVVLGKLGKGVSSQTLDQGFIYTDWDLKVEQVFRNSAATSIQQEEIIVVTRPGGELTINGRHVYAIDEIPDFRAGEEVVLYLRSLPSVGTYGLSEPNGFFISRSNVIPMLESYVHLFVGVKRDQLLQLVQDAPICISPRGQQ